MSQFLDQLSLLYYTTVDRKNILTSAILSSPMHLTNYYMQKVHVIACLT